MVSNLPVIKQLTGGQTESHTPASSTQHDGHISLSCFLSLSFMLSGESKLSLSIGMSQF